MSRWARRRPSSRERGIILVAVLWLGIGLALAAASLLSDTRRESYFARAEIGTAQAVELARSALNIAMADLGRSGALPRTPRDGTPRSLALPGGIAAYVIQDEKGKVDINRAPAVMLQSVLAAVQGRGRDAFDAASLANRIVTARGGEGDRRRPLTLARVLAGSGLDAGAMRRAGSVLTEHSYSTRINPRTAPEAVLAAVPGMEPVAVAAILEQRAAGGTLPQAGAAQSWLRETEGPVYRIEAEGRLANGISARISALVIAEGDGLGGGSTRFRIIESRVLQ